MENNDDGSAPPPAAARGPLHHDTPPRAHMDASAAAIGGTAASVVAVRTFEERNCDVPVKEEEGEAIQSREHDQPCWEQQQEQPRGAKMSVRADAANEEAEYLSSSMHDCGAVPGRLREPEGQRGTSNEHDDDPEPDHHQRQRGHGAALVTATATLAAAASERDEGEATHDPHHRRPRNECQAPHHDTNAAATTEQTATADGADTPTASVSPAYPSSCAVVAEEILAANALSLVAVKEEPFTDDEDQSHGTNTRLFREMPAANRESCAVAYSSVGAGSVDAMMKLISGSIQFVSVNNWQITGCNVR